MSIRDKSKKDRRPQERKLLIQIASSTVNLLQCQSGCPKGEDDENDEFHYYSGMQDLIAVLLIHVESPSLTSLLLKQIWKSHLRVYFRRPSLQKVVDNDDDDECQSFASCIDWEGEKSNDSQPWSMVSRYFPLCQVLDEELHASISRMEYGEWIVCEEIHKWVSSWFCCHDTLPMHVISRVVDFFLASHPQMPMWVQIFREWHNATSYSYPSMLYSFPVTCHWQFCVIPTIETSSSTSHNRRITKWFTLLTRL